MSWLKRLRDARDVMLNRKVAADSIPVLQQRVDRLARDLKTARDTAALSIRNVGVSGEAKWNRVIQDEDREWAATRTPIGYFVTFHVAEDIYDNWFTVDDPKTDEPDEDLDLAVQNVLTQLKAKQVFTRATILERVHGWSAIAVGYAGTKDLSEPVTGHPEIRDLYPYSKRQITVEKKDTNVNSVRYGLPEVYSVNLQGGGKKQFHYTRILHLNTRFPLASTVDEWTGASVLDAPYNDLETLENMRWSIGQTMFRYGPGFPDIEIQGATKEQVDDFYASGQFANINARTYFVHNERQKLEFKGVGGTALDPEKFIKPVMESASVATKIPEAILRGVQAGALTGSEVNQQDYFKVISSAQSAHEPHLRWLIDALFASGQITAVKPKTYVLNWLGGFEVSDQEKAQTVMLENNALMVSMNWRTFDEVRAKDGLPTLQELGIENGEALGKTILGLQKAAPAPFSPFKQSPEPNQTRLDELKELEIAKKMRLYDRLVEDLDL